MPRVVGLWGPVLALMALIFALSSQPALPDIAPQVSDKQWHAGTYAALAALVGRALAGGAPVAMTAGRAAAAAAIAAAYGASDEWHQSFVPGRTADHADWLADVAGAAAASAGLYAWGIIARSRRVRGVS
jgi:VanZ family protein